MNQQCSQPSDNPIDFAASFLRRPDQPVSAAKPAELLDHPHPDPREEQFHDPERWDGLS
jgi:hypothetical protein